VERGVMGMRGNEKFLIEVPVGFREGGFIFKF
jgi:hypothetical protein